MLCNLVEKPFVEETDPYGNILIHICAIRPSVFRGLTGKELKCGLVVAHCSNYIRVKHWHLFGHLLDILWATLVICKDCVFINHLLDIFSITLCIICHL